MAVSSRKKNEKQTSQVRDAFFAREFSAEMENRGQRNNKQR